MKSTSPAVLLVGLALVTAACSLADSSRTPRVSSVSLKDGPDDLWSYDLAEKGWPSPSQLGNHVRAALAGARKAG